MKNEFISFLHFIMPGVLTHNELLRICEIINTNLTGDLPSGCKCVPHNEDIHVIHVSQTNPDYFNYYDNFFECEECGYVESNSDCQMDVMTEPDENGRRLVIEDIHAIHIKRWNGGYIQIYGSLTIEEYSPDGFLSDFELEIDFLERFERDQSDEPSANPSESNESNLAESNQSESNKLPDFHSSSEFNTTSEFYEQYGLNGKCKCGH